MSRRQLQGQPDCEYACKSDNTIIMNGKETPILVPTTEDTKQCCVINNQFLFEARPRAKQILFHAKSNIFMPQLVALDIGESVTAMYVEVTLVPKPSPDLVDAATGGQVNVDTNLGHPRLSPSI